MSDRVLMVTGHRPPKLGGYDNYEAHMRIKMHMKEEIRRHSPSKVITGMALGTDQLFALAAHELGVPFIAAVPFTGQDSRWPETSQLVYRDLLSKAAALHVISSGVMSNYSAVVEAMHVRNHWMADRSTDALAYWNGEESGGTYECVMYLRRCAEDPDHMMRNLTIQNPAAIINISEDEWLNNFHAAREAKDAHERGERDA